MGNAYLSTEKRDNLHQFTTQDRVERFKQAGSGEILIWFVVWNMAFIFHFIYGIILPIDELIFFKMVKTTNH
jgi:hypothetical protein